MPRCTDKLGGSRAVAARRARAAAGLHGQVVEIGFGSGLDLPHLPDTVERVLAVDPSSTARQLAAPRLADSRVPVDFVGADAQVLPLDDASVDGALTTFTLCTIPDVDAALGELHRVLRSGGELHFLEHGLAPDRRVARWQHRLTPLQRRLMGGCHFDRPVDDLLTRNGFRITRLDTGYLGWPKVATYLYEGVAVPA